MIKGPSKSMVKRMLFAWFMLLAIMIGVIGGRLFYLMVIKSDFYQQKAAQQQLYDNEISAERGKIYDRNGELLATSAQVWTVYVTPNAFSSIEGEKNRADTKADIATNLSAILGLDYKTVFDNLEKKVSYQRIMRNVEKPAADKIRKYIATSEYKVGQFIGLEESSKRYYPNNTLASSVLGFVGSDNQGLYGIEKKYDSDLIGVPGRVVAAKDAKGNGMPLSYELEIEATPGNSLVTSLDTYIQSVCEKYLDQAVIDNKITERGAVICMNVNSGEILAMAVAGDFDPNSAFDLSPENQAIVDALDGEEKSAMITQLRNVQWRNKAVSDTYEPGSVFKIVTAAMALEEGTTSIGNHYNCNGYIVVAGRRYNCHKREGHGAETLTNAVQNSCNPVFITFGQQLGATTFSKYFEAFGLGEKTGIDLPGEALPTYHKLSSMGITELASSSFGQTFKVTPIQMITAISAAVNGGYLVQPHIVNEVVDNDGNTVKSVATSVKRQVISTTTSETIRVLMEAVVDGGGGKNAYVSGYRIGGKTGTSQKVSEMIESGESGLYVASFCGVAPINDPEIALLVILDEPHGDAYYGGTIAAPVGGQILSEILPYMGIEPQYSDEELSKIGVRVPSVTGQKIEFAKKAITEKGLKYEIVGNGETVLKQFPASTGTLSSGSVVILYTTEDATVKKTTVPNFFGLSVSDANELAKDNDINIQFAGTSVSGSGVTAYKQSVESGTEVDVGTIVTVYFRTTETAE